ncbi:MAG TPA: hypothetical protein VLK65_21720 [Vicinamibacteria bacterium]|nr:hypothetical protein [Vicinamibacteria bacterium]
MPVLVLMMMLASAPLGTQSARLRQYLSLSEATLENPITLEELRGALLSPEGVATIRALFERSITEGLVLEGRLVTPELGGEATLDAAGLVLVDYPDPVHPLLREMVRLDTDPERLFELLQSSADGKRLLETTGGLHALLYQMSTKAPTDEQRKLLRQVVASAVATHFKTWSTEPLIQAKMIETTDWRGRYVGFWHIHPPRLQGADIAVGIEPSYADMSNAVELGQFLTIVFQPDGFDAYDLSPLARTGAPDLTRAQRISYRSPVWRSHFLERARPPDR